MEDAQRAVGGYVSGGIGKHLSVNLGSHHHAGTLGFSTWPSDLPIYKEKSDIPGC